MLCKIIEHERFKGKKEYVIQQKYFIFRWWWVDVWVNSLSGADCRDSLSS
jgi:hypothetical protein